jgi:hypothetical protein
MTVARHNARLLAQSVSAAVHSLKLKAFCSLDARFDGTTQQCNPNWVLWRPI